MPCKLGDVLIANNQDGCLLGHPRSDLTADAGRKVCRLAPRQFECAREDENFPVEIPLRIPISLHCGSGCRARGVNWLVDSAALVIEILLRLAQSGKQYKACRLGVFKGIVVLKLIADPAANVGEAVALPREVIRCAAHYAG